MFTPRTPPLSPIPAAEEPTTLELSPHYITTPRTPSPLLPEITHAQAAQEAAEEAAEEAAGAARVAARAAEEAAGAAEEASEAAADLLLLQQSVPRVQRNGSPSPTDVMNVMNRSMSPTSQFRRLQQNVVPGAIISDTAPELSADEIQKKAKIIHTIGSWPMQILSEDNERIREELQRLREVNPPATAEFRRRFPREVNPPATAEFRRRFPNTHPAGIQAVSWQPGQGSFSPPRIGGGSLKKRRKKQGKKTKVKRVKKRLTKKNRKKTKVRK